jgi:two-component system, cell cycle response regulator CpdR
MFLTRTPSVLGGSAGSEAQEQPKHGILIVDDEPVLVEEISEYLQADGFPVSFAYDGRAALDVFRQGAPGRFAVVLTDLRMPGMTGYVLARAIIAQTTDAAASEVIVMTGHGSPATHAEAPDGLFAIVQKPVRLSRLAEVVRQAHDAALIRRLAASAGAVSDLPHRA